MIEKMDFGSVLLLENVRFFEGEEKFFSVFSDLDERVDYFVNDAFSVSHREQVSVVGFKKSKPLFSSMTINIVIQSTKAQQFSSQFPERNCISSVLSSCS